MAREIGIRLLTEPQYREPQQLEEFDGAESYYAARGFRGLLRL